MMHRTQIYIPERDIEKLREISKESGKSISEIIRCLLDEYLEKWHRKITRKKQG
jgi:metal-responsive CopG/Arc/MetJ family transcriptional regulator